MNPLFEPEQMEPGTVNVAQLVEDLDEDSMLSFLGIFLEQMPTLLKELATGVVLEENERIRETAHEIKGSSAYIGATRLLWLAWAMEQYACDGEIPPCRQILGELSKEYRRVENNLSRILNIRLPIAA
ncbi:MAG: Hpt domain-containing protein [Methylacidiphilales bacterium]|nr:Hpt domain-containing protein [Candidatus Methylacidiphilales bacterium]